jgi:hypothetical protein
MTKIAARKGMPDVQLSKEEFSQRFRNRFFDPAFEGNEAALAAIIETAWDGYDVYRKNPRKARAGEGFSRPDANLPVEWLETRARITAAEARQKDPASPSRILLINGSMRSDQSCPGEISKSRFSTSASSPRNMAASSTPARPAFQPPSPSATGPAPATRISPWAR